MAADSIVERLVHAVERDRGIRFVGRSNVGDEESVFVPWRELHADARAVAAGLAARGVSPGDHVAILGPTSRALITAIQGCWLAGAASMVLPLPMRMGSIEVFVESTRARIIHGDAALLLIDDVLADFYEPVEGDPPTVRLADVASGAPGAPGADDYERPDDDPERLVILQ
ncbi:MAG: AMP-binding protein, partial [Actinomycetota bacterium]|nr:AMP-binding protein [Actinomycetota bacterium]